MSIDINWETLTGGPDGEALAESIRAFVHDRFQKVSLPRMIRSVHVHTFEFGDTPPRIELQDVCDPLPDFYEDDEDDDGGDDPNPQPARGNSEQSEDTQSRHNYPAETPLPKPMTPTPSQRPATNKHLKPPFPLLDTGISRSGTPTFAGGMSNLGYFHLPLSAGLSGTSTPLAAVAGARFQWPDRAQQQATSTPTDDKHRTTSFSSVTPPSTLAANSRPTSRHTQSWRSSRSPSPTSSSSARGRTTPPSFDRPPSPPPREPDPEDMQVVARISYDGNVRLTLTAEILLDYPMPSFVGIPLLLNITGLTFDGVGILAYIKRKAHFCFLAPEDAEAVAPAMGQGEDGEGRGKVGRLIEAIRVESEIGGKEGGRQSLKNVGKVEKFVLEQVQKIFEDEFVYPSFWTFLV